MSTQPTLVMVPCFAGAPWNPDALTALRDFPMRTPRLPDDIDDLEAVVDVLAAEVKDLECYVLVGDSYGAVISIAWAVRQPRGLQGLVISGGFARNPITSPLLRGLAALAPFFPGPFYRSLTLRAHAANLRSKYDAQGEVPWSMQKTRDFFVRETPHRAFVNRVRSLAHADYVERLGLIQVPTLILTPEDDRLIGKTASEILRLGIRGAEEVVLPATGHMFRFSHPGRYSQAIRGFLDRRVADATGAARDLGTVRATPGEAQGRRPSTV